MAAGDGSQGFGRQKWTDERLDDRKQAVDESIHRIEVDLRVLMPLAGDFGKLEASYAGLHEDMLEIKSQLADAGAAANAANDAARQGRKDTLVAVLGFAAPVTVAIIGGVVTLILGAG